ncbi:MAG: Hsp20/alpha crystallin family protein [Clostridia bacterium]|jgi:HSP20 family molecular chaperone IbpA
MMNSFLPAVFGENLMDVFNDFSQSLLRGWDNPEHVLYGKNASRMMKTDVKETETGYELAVDLPGFKKEEIKLELENGYLTISAAKAVENKDEQNGKVLRQERYSGTMTRSFYVGEHVTEEDVKAKYENGVLCLSVPKKEAPKAPEKKTICIE